MMRRALSRAGVGRSARGTQLLSSFGQPLDASFALEQVILEPEHFGRGQPFAQRIHGELIVMDMLGIGFREYDAFNENAGMEPPAGSAAVADFAENHQF